MALIVLAGAQVAAAQTVTILPLQPSNSFLAPIRPFVGGTLGQASSAQPTHPSVDDDRNGSTFVSMDSWVYPTLERLAALGLIPSQDISIRPWTRQECRRQLRETEDILYGFGDLDTPVNDAIRNEAERLVPDLERELQEPNGKTTATLESMYVRGGTIAGAPLTDGFHFGQTWWNDYGRPLGRGTSAITGYSLRLTSGRWFFHVRQEMQSDPGVRAITPAQANLFNQLDNVPFSSAPTIPPAIVPQPAPAVAAYVRQRPLDLYAGYAFAGYAVSFGKQEIYWGPTTMGPWAFSSNAEPTYNLRLMSTRPHPFPLVPQLGSYRVDLVFGKLSGHKYPARPYYNGQKISLIFGSYFETSFTRWSVLWGVGHPMSLHTLKNNLFSSDSTGATFAYGDRTDPGDRKGDWDFRLHVPGLKEYATIYGDAYSDDEVNPIDAPRRVAWQTGLYMPHLPKAPHVDFRFEMASSEELSQDEGGARFFLNNQYRDSNTNKGFLLGNGVGRDGRAFEGRIGYWVSPRTRIEAGYRQNKISERFLPTGGTVSDGFITGDFAWNKEWSAQVFTQYERFLIPSFMPGRHDNTSARIQITWTPQKNVELIR
ncbi:capsule assembly Wzi family protein [Granulicella tundricola]|uniref:Capsule assembly protein Wzi n=1 Tax=Granulicella tundricola (strain ATCC BAA-1859 / DSM 23138 / MP5ACTX9) TaxID=1198114 RepID=E8X6J9_GRATM|nr:capsule assembly Wzi family protein [Granulicella tundricola]ADW71149.1 hypothetical protein AciX9_3866 [Granulicella tundricola MP5ACTX9]